MSEKAIEKIDKKIEELQKHKLELLVREGKAFKCRKCGEITAKSIISLEHEKEGLCYTCWSKEVRQQKREKLLKMFNGARIIDVEPRNNPFSDIFNVNKIVIEVNGKRYEIRPDGWDELYIEIEEVKRK